MILNYCGIKEAVLHYIYKNKLTPGESMYNVSDNAKGVIDTLLTPPPIEELRARLSSRINTRQDELNAHANELQALQETIAQKQSDMQRDVEVSNELANVSQG